MASEQWWKLYQSDGAGNWVEVKNTRSRTVRNRWMATGESRAYREVWSIGGSFDSAKVYDSTELYTDLYT